MAGAVVGAPLGWPSSWYSVKLPAVLRSRRKALREAGRPGVDHLIRVVIHRGTYSRTDVLWASRQGGVQLLDGRQLQEWAAGASLDDLGLPG